MNTTFRKIFSAGLLVGVLSLPSPLLAQQSLVFLLLRRGTEVDREVTRTDTGRTAFITITLPTGQTATINNSVSRTDTTLARNTSVALPNGNTVSSSMTATRNPDQTVTVTTAVTGPKGNTRINTFTRQIQSPKD